MATHDYKTGLQEIGDGVFAYIREGIGWDICNSGLIVGDEECLVVDAMMVGSMVRTFLEDVRKVTDKPVRYVVDTHHHADHAFGNQFYRPEANVIGHDGCRDSLMRRGADPDVLTNRWPQYEDDWRQLELTPPNVTYSGNMTVHLGNRSVELIHPGPAHTFGDTLVYLADEKIHLHGRRCLSIPHPPRRRRPRLQLDQGHETPPQRHGYRNHGHGARTGCQEGGHRLDSPIFQGPEKALQGVFPPG